MNGARSSGSLRGHGTGTAVALWVAAAMLVASCGDSPTILLVNVFGTLGSGVATSMEVTVNQGGAVQTVVFPPPAGSNAINLPTSFTLLVEGADGTAIEVCVVALDDASTPLGNGCATSPIAVGDVNEFNITLAVMAAVCGDDIISGLEDCDGTNLGGETCTSLSPTFSGGTLACDVDCSFDTSGCMLDPNCGNGTIDPGEECDGGDLGGADCVSAGFPGGTLACETFCQLDDSGCWQCGNNVLDPSEACDGADLAGEDCDSLGLGFSGGTLACDGACNFDTSGCTAPPTCPDGTCDATETCSSCPADCGGCCGDAICDAGVGEDCVSCPADCTPCGSCGDPSICEPGESCPTCPECCGGSCGDGTCDVTAGESCGNCPGDCCSCNLDGVCDSALEDCSTCPGDCPCVCGDGLCAGIETCATCPIDCCGPACGDGFCDAAAGEDCFICPGDCGGCGVFPGAVIVSEVHMNPNGPDAEREFIELYNTTPSDLDVSGLEIENDGGAIFSLPAGLVIPGGGYMVIAGSTSMTTNGCIPVTVAAAWPAFFSLLNGSGGVTLYFAGTTIDQVFWDPGWPLNAGASIELAPTYYNENDNDFAFAWCAASMPFGCNGDFGSPGAVGSCGGAGCGVMGAVCTTNSDCCTGLICAGTPPFCQ